MTENGRPPADLLAEWLSNDHPIYFFGREVVDVNRKLGLDPGDGLRDLVLDIRSNPLGYRSMVRDFAKKNRRQYPHGYPVEDGPAKWTMRQISDREFGAVDWKALADRVFPVLDDNS